MRQRHAALLALAILLTVHPVAYAATVEYRYTLSYRFENRGTEAAELSPEDVAVPLFMDTTRHTVTITEHDAPLGETLTDIDGNRWTVVNVPLTLGPGEDISFTVTYHIESSGEVRPEISLPAAGGFDAIPPLLTENYTDPTETFMSRDPHVSQVALRVGGMSSTVLGAVVKMIDWIAANVEYHNFEAPKYPNRTAVDGLGDCDDQAILLISMCRSLGIPAYMRVGIVIHPDIVDSDTSWEGRLTDTRNGVGWHAWAVIYVPPWGWLPVDLTLAQGRGLDVMAAAPEYDAGIIPCFDVNRQAYIGDSLATRERFISGTVYVEITDVAERLQPATPARELYLVAGLGVAVAAAVVLMFVSGRRREPAAVTIRS